MHTHLVKEEEDRAVGALECVQKLQNVALDVGVRGASRPRHAQPCLATPSLQAHKQSVRHLARVSAWVHNLAEVKVAEQGIGLVLLDKLR
jgi:hypothetical protein